MQTMKLTGFHLEPTNRCVLGCSACERTQFINKFGQKNWHNQDLDLDALVKFMDMDVTGLRWGLCGNTGDPIYYSRLEELIAYIKDQQGRIVLTTNGSYRTDAWWKQTLQNLTQDDVVEFSVDGLPETSPQYRTNSDWATIDTGMRTACETSAQVVWKMVPFAFNEHEIDAVRAMAESRGMTVKLDPSNRFGDDDPLRPQEQTIIWHRGTGNMDPMCATGDQHYISAGGQYSPCCYSANHVFHYKSQFHANKDNYNISNTTLSQVLEQLGSYDEQMRIDPAPVCSYTCRTL
jgi:MoaA/NifB/PqqE/SkfB family radical SAM enzyme